MKICFLWDWPPTAIEQTVTWDDGLAAALKELRNRGHEVEVFMPDKENYVIKHPDFNIQVCENLPVVIHAWGPDVILHWGDMTRPNALPLKELNIPMAICFAGGDVDSYNTPYFDHIFVESVVYKQRLADAGYEASIAFGTNTDLFQPRTQNKVFDTIFPATFALWKRHNLYAQATEGLVSLAVGYMYTDHEQECWQECLDKGITILPHASAQVLQGLMAASTVCVIPSRSDGGSQRTVLEAMAMNIPVIVADSDKFDFAGDLIYRAEPTAESIRGYIAALMDGEREAGTRDFILNNWSHIQYADALEKGLQSIL